MSTDQNPIPPVTRDDPAAHSGDVEAENVAALKALFPSIVTDGKVDFDVLRQLLGDEVEDGAERYGLNWKGKARARAFALTPSLGTLRPAKEDSKDWDTTKNIVIEGDNLEVLKLLRKSYSDKIKLVYIDPPYNTGKDFVYPDNYINSIANYEALTGQRDDDGARMTTNKDSSGRYHTDWLNMLYPRIMLAKEMLRDDGIIAVSIADEEVGNLRLLLDDVFSPSSFIAQIVRATNSVKNQSLFVSVNHDYVLIYAKSISTLSLKAAEQGPWNINKNNIEAYLKTVKDLQQSGMSEDEITEELKELTKRPRFMDFVNYWYFDERGLYQKADLGGVRGGNPKPIMNPLTEELDPVPPGGFRYGPDKLAKLAAEKRIHFHKDGSLPRLKRYLSENATTRPRGITSDDQRADAALLARYEIEFDNPKQLSFMKRLVEIVDADSIVLDFFAGSATTAHAVLSLNAQDGGSRRHISVQLAQPVTGVRHKNVFEMTCARLKAAAKDLVGTSSDTGFRAFKLATSNLKPWQPSDNLQVDLAEAADNLVRGRSEDDLLVELLLKTGIDLALPGIKREIAGRTVHLFGGGTLVVCLADIPAAQARALGDGIADWLDEVEPPAPTTFFFKDSGFDAGGLRSAEARANLAATLRQRLGEDAIEKLGAI